MPTIHNHRRLCTLSATPAHRTYASSSGVWWCVGIWFVHYRIEKMSCCDTRPRQVCDVLVHDPWSVHYWIVQRFFFMHSNLISYTLLPSGMCPRVRPLKCSRLRVVSPAPDLSHIHKTKLRRRTHLSHFCCRGGCAEQVQPGHHAAQVPGGLPGGLVHTGRI